MGKVESAVSIFSAFNTRTAICQVTNKNVNQGERVGRRPGPPRGSCSSAMGRCAVMVIGPAGSGKSTFCDLMRSHCEALKRRVHVINLDPAAEEFSYPVAADIRDLVPLGDVMEELHLGPNGALIYCMEYLIQHIDWLNDELEDLGGDEYVFFDCPGQIELYSHVPAMSMLVQELQRIGFRVASAYLLDSQFIADPTKFISGVLCCLSAMTSLELPHINVLTKCDLVEDKVGLDEFLDADTSQLRDRLDGRTRPDFFKLNHAICELIDNWNMVQFLSLDPKDEDSIDLVLGQLDNSIQYHDDLEPREPEDQEVDPDD